MNIEHIQTLPHPRVLINICSHGNETIGLEVQNMCADLEIITGSLHWNIGNPIAVEFGKRFVECDLNRSFPGNADGKYEERLAHELMQSIPCFDYVIDIHSTVSGIQNCLIIEDDSEEIQKLISACMHCDTVLHMTATRGSSLFTATRLADRVIPAIAFEYGDNSHETTMKTYDDICAVLSAIGIVEAKEVMIKHSPKQFECYATFPKSDGDVLLETIHNYQLVTAVSTVAHHADGTAIITHTDFYPILFGETNYVGYFGFMGRPIDTCS